MSIGNGNILGNPFDAFVSSQVTQRQNLLGLDEKYINSQDATNLMWKHNNSSWIRLVSSVNITSEKATSLGLDASLSEDNLAKEFIIYNGVSSTDNTSFNPSSNNTQYFPTNDNFSLRNSYGFAGLNQGLRPMPGIESMKMSYYNRGALANVEIEITAYSKEQLQIIDALFMHPGYTLLLEWGHSYYINNNDGSISKTDPANLITKPFTKMFNTKTDQYAIYSSIKEERKLRSANYEGFFGIIKNFRYTYQPDGTYKITIFVVSQGDLLEKLKINVADKAAYDITNNNLKTTEERSEAAIQVQNDIKIYEEDIVELTAKIEKTKLEINNDQAIKDSSIVISNAFLLVNAVESLFRDDDSIVTTSEENLEYYQTRLKNAVEGLANANARYTALTGEDLTADNPVDRFAGKSVFNKKLKEWKDYLDINGESTDKSLISIKTITRQPPEITADGVEQIASKEDNLYFVQFDILLNWIEDNLLLYNGKTRIPYFKIDTSAKNYCLSYPKHISADPEICMIPVNDGDIARGIQKIELDENNRRVILDPESTAGLTEEQAENKKYNLTHYYGQLPANFIEANYASDIFTDKGAEGFYEINEDFIIKNNAYIGSLMKIYINLNLVANTINNNIDSDGGVTLIKFLNELLRGINAALGYCHSFEVVYDRETNYIKIYDFNNLKYGGLKISQETAFFNLHGFYPHENSTQGCFIDDVNFTSELSNNFNNMITVSSQVNNNVLGMTSTGLVNYNRGLTDRIIPSKLSGQEIQNGNKEITEEDLQQLVKTANLYAQQIWKDFNLDRGTIDAFMALNRELANFFINKAASKQDIPAPTVIPFNLSLKMMGLSGMKLFERFTTDEKILPPQFSNKYYDFIVKAISHEFRNNRWTTLLESQLITKENANEPIKVTESTAKKKEFKYKLGTGNSKAQKGNTLLRQVLINSGLNENSALYALAYSIGTKEGWNPNANGGVGSRAYRNNNPGNLDYSANLKKIDPDVALENNPFGNDRFAHFTTAELGAKALTEKIKSWANGNMLVTRGNQSLLAESGKGAKYVEGRKPTLTQFIYTYAPPNENNTEKYITDVLNDILKIKSNATRNTLVSDLIA
jgi:hypothetical protein